MNFIIKSLNISENKGTIKTPVSEVEINMNGIKNDAHSGNWNRQISLLAKEQVDEFSKQYNKEFNFGDFAENITTEGIDFKKVKLLDILKSENVELMITQKGKKCHGGGCAVFTAVGHCVMPKEGVFADVVKPGKLKTGEKMEYSPKVFKIGVVTLSDRASRGEYQDISGPKINEILKSFFQNIDRNCEITNYIIPDSSEELSNIIKVLSKDFDIVFTTGGTGMSAKDITIETITPMLDKQLPGIMEMVRIKYGQENPKALLSRSIAGTIGKMLIFCMPGSPKAVSEYLFEINKVLEHLIYMVYGLDNH